MKRPRLECIDNKSCTSRIHDVVLNVINTIEMTVTSF